MDELDAHDAIASIARARMAAEVSSRNSVRTPSAAHSKNGRDRFFRTIRGSGMRSSGQTTPESGARTIRTPSFTSTKVTRNDKANLKLFLA